MRTRFKRIASLRLNGPAPANGLAQAEQKLSWLNGQSLALYGRVLRYVRPYTRWMLLSIVTLLLSAGLGLVPPLVVRNLVDVVLVEATPGRLNQLALGLLLLFSVQAIFSFVNRLTLAYVGERVVADLRIQLFTHLQRLSLRYYADHRTGEIVSRLTNDVSLLQGAITHNLVDLLRQGITLIGATIFLFVLNWRLTLLILAGMPIIVLVMTLMSRRIRKVSRAVQDALAEVANVAEETTAAVRIVKSFAREAHEISRFTARVNDSFAAAMDRARISAVLAPVIGLLAFSSVILTLWFGSQEVLSGRLTAGGLVAYLVYTLMVAGPMSSLAAIYGQFQAALGAIERVFELLDTRPDIDGRMDRSVLPRVAGQITFERVSFAYGAGGPGLREISFRVEPGELVALVGPSGAGKTTLVNLIPRFYDVVSGCITIDGHDVRDVNLFSLRDQVGVVPQETMLFSDTVLANIRYGKLNATQAEVEAAAHAANAHQFIVNDLPQGYLSRVGEKGIKLSGGQRQRVAIARAILKDPRILILDEATSSLDSESERLVQEALERLMAGRTSFVIAHRLSTVVQADRILVLEAGRLVEQGTHAQLLQRPSGVYTRLHRMQFAAYASNSVNTLG